MHNRIVLWLAPLFFLMAFAPFSKCIDLEISSYFFTKGNPGHFSQNPLWQWIYDVGPLPGLILAVLSLSGFIASLLFQKLSFLKRPSLYLVLVCLIGSALLAHGVFKDHWGRPRPKQTIAFGGPLEYRPFYLPTAAPMPSRSFVCGHATMGFYFLAVVRLGIRRHKRWLFLTGLFLTVLLGIGLGLSRIAQGGHYFSDVLASMALMWWTALFFEPLVGDEGTH